MDENLIRTVWKNLRRLPVRSVPAHMDDLEDWLIGYRKSLDGGSAKEAASAANATFTSAGRSRLNIRVS